MVSVQLFHYATQMSVLHEETVILADKICSIILIIILSILINENTMKACPY